jgi:F0F1-type ATP synthase assembly protein I
MSRPKSPGDPPKGGADPWAAFGYLVSGVAVYGLLGWVLGRWLHASYLIPLGIVLGAALGLVLVFYQVGRAPKSPATNGEQQHSTNPGPESAAPGAPNDERGDAD